jgi:hypothetical protein
MSIERSESIRFHEQGTLNAVTRWIASHDEGIAEWFKNVRRQYQVDRADVAHKHRVAVLLLQDAHDGNPARIGVLDVGGATFEDVTAWSTWQDPAASRRRLQVQEEETQGNGGKAYMYRLFTGETRILGVKNGRRNYKGFEGPPESVERGTPGWIPSVAEGRDAEISSWKAELRDALAPYGVCFETLPERVRTAIADRQAFTLVEGAEPCDLYKGRIDADQLVEKVVRHEQSTLCLEQVDFYAMHNCRLINNGKVLRLPPIAPWPGLDDPIVIEIPDQLPLENGQMISTTEGGIRDSGRLVLKTSAKNMPAAYKNLKSRWKITYRTRHQVIGTKPISEFFPAPPPGAQYVYGSVDLAALEPRYVEHGRRRPKPGPLVEALDQFISKKIHQIARQIHAKRQEKLDRRALDEVYEENRLLDEFKNQFLPHREVDNGAGDSGGDCSPGGAGRGAPTEWGKVPDALEHSADAKELCIAKGLVAPIRPLLKLSVRDTRGRPVRADVEWRTSDFQVASVSPTGDLKAKGKGSCEVRAGVKGTDLQTDPVLVHVWNVRHVRLTPRTLEMPLGTRQQITAEVINDEGIRSTNVLLDWRHDADDQMIVRVSQRGLITANRLGRTSVTAGAGDVWARRPVEVRIVPNPNKPARGQGFPRLLVTDKDLDPSAERIREGDPDQPPLWQEPSDFIHNVWWLNLHNPQAAFAFRLREANPPIWREFHAEQIVEMVVRAWMTEEFSRRGENERPEVWAAHLAAMDRHRVRIIQQMWERLQPYVIDGRLDADDEKEARDTKGNLEASAYGVAATSPSAIR